jgi:hypothetical protein
MNAFVADCVLSVHVFQLENCWTDFDGIWYGFPAIGNTNMVDAQNCEVGVTLEPLNVWLYSDVW